MRYEPAAYRLACCGCVVPAPGETIARSIRCPKCSGKTNLLGDIESVRINGKWVDRATAIRLWKHGQTRDDYHTRQRRLRAEVKERRRRDHARKWESDMSRLGIWTPGAPDLPTPD